MEYNVRFDNSLLVRKCNMMKMARVTELGRPTDRSKTKVLEHFFLSANSGVNMILISTNEEINQNYCPQCSTL